MPKPKSAQLMRAWPPFRVTAEKIAAFGSSYILLRTPPVGAAEGCDLLILKKPQRNLESNAKAVSSEEAGFCPVSNNPSSRV